MEQIDALRDIVSLLESKGHNEKKKKRLAARMIKELDNLISKYEYMYDKYVLKNKPLNKLYIEKEKEIKIVQNSIRTFFPYIIAYNVAQMSEQ